MHASSLDLEDVPIGTGRLDLVRHVFHSASGPQVRLSGREAELLSYLARHRPQAVDRDQLLVEVWGHRRLTATRAVDAAVTRLRKKIERDPSMPRVLITVHGHGYRLVLGDDLAPEPEPETPVRPPLTLSDRTVDLVTGEVRGPEGALQLTARERFVLDLLLQANGAWVTAQRIVRTLGMGGRTGVANTVIWRLRAKLERDPSEPIHLLSERGSGYRLSASSPPPVHPADAARRKALKGLCDYVGRLLAHGRCVVWVVAGPRLEVAAATDPPGEALAPVALGEGAVGGAASEGDCVRLDEASGQDGIRSRLAVPIRVGTDVVGVIDLTSPEPERYGQQDEIVLLSLATIAAAAFAVPGRPS